VDRRQVRLETRFAGKATNQVVADPDRLVQVLARFGPSIEAARGDPQPEFSLRKITAGLGILGRRERPGLAVLPRRLESGYAFRGLLGGWLRISRGDRRLGALIESLARQSATDRAARNKGQGAI